MVVAIAKRSSIFSDDLPAPVHKPFGGGEDEDEEMADPDQVCHS